MGRSHSFVMDRRYGSEPTGLRIKGRAGVELRRHRLLAEPLCRICAGQGRTVLAQEVDHIVPLSFGGPDTDDNVQSLCVPCHLLKSATEDTSHEAASTHPEWLRPASGPLVIVCGPPCSGKTTYVRANQGLDDIVLDIDIILAQIDPTYEPWSGATPGGLLAKGLRVRNATLGALSKMDGRSAWLIVSAPTYQERSWWQQKLGGSVVLLDTPMAECKRRAIERGTPRAIAGIDDWFASAQRPWTRGKAHRLAIGQDGWPIE